MSHFAVLITEKNPELQLAPFQENNMGNCPEKYLAFHDTEDEMLKEYENDGTEMVVMPDGTFRFKWDPEFAVDDPDSKDPFKSKKIVIPAELEVRHVGYKEKYATFEIFASEFHGNEDRDPKKNRYGYWENPNAKWDWYSLGGRFTGYFKVKQRNLLGTNDHSYEAFMGFTAAEMKNFVDMYANDRPKFEKVVSKYNGKSRAITTRVEEIVNEELTIIPEHKVGTPGLMTEEAKPGYADQLLKKDIDIDGMRREAREEAEKRYDFAMTIIGNLPVNKTWNRILEEHPNLPHDSQVDLYRAELRVAAWKSAELDAIRNKTEWPFDFFTGADDFLVSCDAYVKVAENSALTSYALLHEGKWYQRGEMGWWGMAKDEKDVEKWDEEFNKLFDSLPDDTLLSVYDCHI